MALDTSLLQATAANNRAAADNQAGQVQRADTANLERQKMQNENMQQVGKSAAEGVQQGMKSNEDMITMDDQMVNGIKTAYPETPLASMAEQMKGKKLKSTYWTALITNQNNQEKEKLKAEHQAKLQEMKDQFKLVGTKITKTSKGPKGEDQIQNGVFQWDEEQGKAVPIYEGEAVNKNNPDSGKAAEKRTSLQEKRLTAQYDRQFGMTTRAIMANDTVKSSLRSVRRVDQGLKIMETGKQFTQQNLDQISTDISGIISGGAPTVQGTKIQSYHLLEGMVATFKQKWLSKPINLNIPEVKEKLKADLTDLREVNKQFIADVTDTYENTMPFIDEDRYKKKWDKFKEEINSIGGGEGSSNGSKTPPKGNVHVRVGNKEFYVPSGNLDALKKDHPNTVVLTDGK